MSSEEIARNLNLPVRVVRDTVFALEKAGLIVPVVSPDEKTGRYVPARDIHTIRVYDVIHRVETSGHAAFEPEQSPEFETMDTIVQALNRAESDSPANRLIMDIEIDTPKEERT